MKKFMMTTAIVAVTSLGATAQTADQTQQQQTQDQQQQTQQQQDRVPAFLASDFTGKNLYTFEGEDARMWRDEQREWREQQRMGTAPQPQQQPGMQDQQQAEADPQQQQAQTGTQPEAQPGAEPGVHPQAQQRQRWETGDAFAGQRDQWNNVGNIDDVIMTADGEIRGIIIDVGGFLGIGARTVMVDIDELAFVPDHTNGTGWFADTADDFSIVVAMSEEELESLPEWDEDQLRAGMEPRARHEPGARMGHDGDVALQEGRDAEHTDDVAMQDDQAVQDDPAMQQDRQARTQAPEGYEMMADEQRTADNLMGADVYDAQGEQIGSVEDLVLGDGNEISHLILDIGGFLGIGEHRVALDSQEVDIFWSEADNEVRVQVPMTQEELEQMPEYEG